MSLRHEPLPSDKHTRPVLPLPGRTGVPGQPVCCCRALCPRPPHGRHRRGAALVLHSVPSRCGAPALSVQWARQGVPAQYRVGLAPVVLVQPGSIHCMRPSASSCCELLMLCLLRSAGLAGPFHLQFRPHSRGGAGLPALSAAGGPVRRPVVSGWLDLFWLVSHLLVRGSYIV